MSFTNRLPVVVPGYGTPTQNDAFFLKQAIVLSGTTAQSNQIPAGANFPVTISKGKIRAKFSAPAASGANPAITADFILYDGTTWYDVGRITSPVLAIGSNTPSASIPNYMDRVLEFESDINAIQLYVNTTLTGTSPIVLMDVEISGTT